MERRRYQHRQGAESAPTDKTTVKKRYWGKWNPGELFWWLFGFWVIPALLWGLVSGRPSWRYTEPVYTLISPACLDRPRRIEIIFPSYIAGCFLGGELGREWYWDEKENAQ